MFIGKEFIKMANEKVQEFVAKIKELVHRGNVSRIVVRKGEQELLNIPVNAGIVGGIVAVSSAKWVLLAGILATIGFGCCVEIIRTDGQIVNVMDEETGKQIRCTAQNAVNGVKDALHFEQVVDETAEDVQDPVEEVPFEEANTEESAEDHTEE